MADIREAAYAGSWYPGARAELDLALDRYLADKERFLPPSKIRCLICPHAGYMYSGPTAASAYKCIDAGAYNTVVVLAPSHRVPFEGVAPWPSGAYSTPLGEIPIDEGFCRAAFSGWGMSTENPVAHRMEHSLEMQLPFLQKRLPGFKLVPVIIGGHSPDLAADLGTRLRDAIGTRDDVLVVASTDLSHFHDAKTAEKLDGTARGFIEKIDWNGLWQAYSGGACELCGIMPVLVVLYMTSKAGGAGCKVLSYTHSGHVTGDMSNVVGYLSAVSW